MSGGWTGTTAGGGQGGGPGPDARSREKVLRNDLLQVFINVT